MTEGARNLFANLAADYIKKGYPLPTAMTFEALDLAMERWCSELRAAGLLKQVAAYWTLTDQAINSIVRNTPMSTEAKELLAELKSKYVADGYPPRHGWSIEPDGRTSARAFNELRARGYLEPLTAEWYKFSEAAVRRMTA